MAKNYAPLIATAKAAIARFGFDMTFRDKGTLGDPVTGLGAVAGVDRVLKAVKTGANDNNFPNTVILAGDRAFIVEGAVVSLFDKWVNGAALWSIEAVNPIEPNNVDTIIVKVLVRG